MSFIPTSPALYQKATQVSVTGTTNPTVADSFTLKAGMMGANDALEFWTLTSHTNSGNAKTIALTIGASTLFSIAPTTSTSDSRLTLMFNRNSVSSQVFNATSLVGGIGSSSSAVGTATENTATDLTIAITLTLASSGETVSLEAWGVRLIKNS